MSVYELKKRKQAYSCASKIHKIRIAFIISRRGRLDMATVVVTALGFLCVSLNEKEAGRWVGL